MNEAYLSVSVAGQLLNLAPSGFNHYRKAHPERFERSTARRIALADLTAILGTIPAEAIILADNALNAKREYWRQSNNRRSEQRKRHNG